MKTDPGLKSSNCPVTGDLGNKKQANNNRNVLNFFTLSDNWRILVLFSFIDY